MLEDLPAELGLSFEILTVKGKTDNLISHDNVFRKLSRFKILMRHRHLTIMDTTHNTNYLDWNLFTVMVRHEYRNCIPKVHMLHEREDDDIISFFFKNTL